MDESEFWQLIEAAKAVSKGDVQAQVAQLHDSLAKLQPAEIASFDEHFRSFLARAYTWELWAAAYIINGGCSDDCFEYFRGWLIAQGKDPFENALRDPQTLTPIANPDADGEPMLYVAQTVYESKTGKDLPQPDVVQPSEPRGKQWDEESVDQLYPVLAARFS